MYCEKKRYFFSHDKLIIIFFSKKKYVRTVRTDKVNSHNVYLIFESFQFHYSIDIVIRNYLQTVPLPFLSQL